MSKSIQQALWLSAERCSLNADKRLALELRVSRTVNLTTRAGTRVTKLARLLERRRIALSIAKVPS